MYLSKHLSKNELLQKSITWTRPVHNTSVFRVILFILLCLCDTLQIKNKRQNNSLLSTSKAKVRKYLYFIVLRGALTYMDKLLSYNLQHRLQNKCSMAVPQFLLGASLKQKKCIYYPIPLWTQYSYMKYTHRTSDPQHTHRLCKAALAENGRTVASPHSHPATFSVHCKLAYW